MDEKQQVAQTAAETASAQSGDKFPAMHIAVGGVVLILAVVAFFVVWNNGLEDRLFPKRWGVVEAGQIFRSGRIHPALMEETLRKNGVKAIVNLCGKDKHADAEAAVGGKLGIDITYVPMSGDGTADAVRYAAAVGKIIEMRKAGKPVLVHCAAGTQRTGGVVAVYRLLVEKASPAEVLKEMTRFGWRAGQNENRLPRFINDNLPAIAKLLADQGAIPAVPAPIPVLEIKN